MSKLRLRMWMLLAAIIVPGVLDANAQRAPGTGRAETYNVWRNDDPRYNGRTYTPGVIVWASYERRPRFLIRRAGDARNVADGHPVALRTTGGWLALDGLHSERPSLGEASWNPLGVVEFTWPDADLIERMGDGTGYYDTLVIRTPDRGEILADAFSMSPRDDFDCAGCITFRWFFLGAWFDAYFRDEMHGLQLCSRTSTTAIPCVDPVSTKPLRSAVAVAEITYDRVYDAPAPPLATLAARFAHRAFLLTGRLGGALAGKWKVVPTLPQTATPRKRLAQLNQFAAQGWDHAAILSPPPEEP